MTIYLQQLLLAVIVTYIVELSGFTRSWRHALARRLGFRDETELRPLPPFDCAKCAVWWADLILALCVGQLSLLTVFSAAILSLLSDVISSALLFIHEALAWLFDKLTPQ